MKKIERTFGHIWSELFLFNLMNSWKVTDTMNGLDFWIWCIQMTYFPFNFFFHHAKLITMMTESSNSIQIMIVYLVKCSKYGVLFLECWVKAKSARHWIDRARRIRYSGNILKILNSIHDFRFSNYFSQTVYCYLPFPFSSFCCEHGLYFVGLD